MRLVLLALLLPFPNLALSQTSNVWQGTTNNAPWSNDALWSQGHMPTADEFAIFGTNAVPDVVGSNRWCIVDTTVNCRAIVLSNYSGTLTFSGSSVTLSNSGNAFDHRNGRINTSNSIFELLAGNWLNAATDNHSGTGTLVITNASHTVTVASTGTPYPFTVIYVGRPGNTSTLNMQSNPFRGLNNSKAQLILCGGNICGDFQVRSGLSNAIQCSAVSTALQVASSSWTCTTAGQTNTFPSNFYWNPGGGQSAYVSGRSNTWVFPSGKVFSVANSSFTLGTDATTALATTGEVFILQSGATTDLNRVHFGSVNGTVIATNAFIAATMSVNSGAWCNFQNSTISNYVTAANFSFVNAAFINSTNAIIICAPGAGNVQTLTFGVGPSDWSAGKLIHSGGTLLFNSQMSASNIEIRAGIVNVNGYTTLADWLVYGGTVAAGTSTLFSSSIVQTGGVWNSGTSFVQLSGTSNLTNYWNLTVAGPVTGTNTLTRVSGTLSTDANGRSLDMTGGTLQLANPSTLAVGSLYNATVQSNKLFLLHGVKTNSTGQLIQRPYRGNQQ